MVTFFRKIRRDLISNNRFYNYLKYALGEIMLVVLGILIALQINNWNEERKSQKRIVSFFIEIQNNLEQDILKSNDLIDNYIVQDSLLINILQNRVAYSGFFLSRSRIF